MLTKDQIDRTPSLGFEDETEWKYIRNIDKHNENKRQRLARQRLAKKILLSRLNR